jgi:hypothetical protein
MVFIKTVSVANMRLLLVHERNPLKIGSTSLAQKYCVYRAYSTGTPTQPKIL